MSPEPESPAIEGLAHPREVTFARTPFRAREMGMTLSAWRLSVTADEGHAAVTFVELPDGTSFYRGEGVCLGWSQERLAAGYAALRPHDDEPPLEMLQLG